MYIVYSFLALFFCIAMKRSSDLLYLTAKVEKCVDSMKKSLRTPFLLRGKKTSYNSLQQECYTALMDILSLIKTKLVVSKSSEQLVQLLSNIKSSEQLSRNTLSEITPLCSDIKTLANAGNSPQLKLLKNLL